MHSKTHTNAYQIAKYFFKKLMELTDLIIIAGNHDCNLSNLNDIDALTVVIDGSGKINNKSNYLTKKWNSNKLYY